MVGMTIGLLGMVIMLQMLSFSEGQKRTTSGSDDAQNAGAIALYGLQRDIQLSGYGISAPNMIGCSVSWTPSIENTASVTVPMAPVTINSPLIAGSNDPNTDTVMVMYGNGNGPGEGDALSGQPDALKVLTVGTPTSYIVNDRVIAQYGVRQTPCSLVMDTVNSIVAPNVTVAAGVANIMTVNTSASAFPTLYDLGQSPTIRAYAVRGGSLTVCDYTAYNCGNHAAITTANQAIWVPVAGNVVSLKAQYGRDTNGGTMTGIVDSYDQTTPATFCNWARTSAVRIALVSMGNLDTKVIVAAAPTWEGSNSAAASAPAPATVGNPINLTQIPNLAGSWQNYHYKTFQTTVPIRNITMQGVVTGC